MKKLFDKKGETYIDVAITVMIVAFVLVFAVNMVSLVALNQNITSSPLQEKQKRKTISRSSFCSART